MLQNQNTSKANRSIGLALAILVMINTQAAAFNNPPPRCDGFGDMQSFSLTDWEVGIEPWTVGTHDVTSPTEFVTLDWAVVGSLPHSRPGRAAFVENVAFPDEPTDEFPNANCESFNQMGALTLDSPAVVIPADVLVPRISIDHWVAIEADFDGGNFKISVNGSAFNLIPLSVIEVGPYNGTLLDAQTGEGDPLNENPLAGQDAFTDDISLSSPNPGWGQSHINLLGIAEAGDTIKLRFDFGIDECGGSVGWYVDEIEFYSCSTEVPPSDTSLTLVKQVINDNGGGALNSDWTLTASGPSGFSGSGPTISSGPDFLIGSYNLSESGGPGGYSASDWDCVGGIQSDADTITVSQGQAVTCTITNDDIAPVLTLVKVVTNDNGGNALPSDWTLNATGPTSFGGSGPSVSTDSSFEAGSYDLSESGGPGGYSASDWDCVGGIQSDADIITVSLGQVVTCTITNDDIDPLDVIFKDGFE